MNMYRIEKDRRGSALIVLLAAILIIAGLVYFQLRSDESGNDSKETPSNAKQQIDQFEQQIDDFEIQNQDRLNQGLHPEQ